METVRTVQFHELFQQNPDGSLSPKKVIQVGGITFGPGVAFGPGVSFGGINFFDIRGRNLAIVDQADGTVLIKGYY